MNDMTRIALHSPGTLLVLCDKRIWLWLVSNVMHALRKKGSFEMRLEVKGDTRAACL
jgi:hypothetical protein